MVDFESISFKTFFQNAQDAAIIIMDEDGFILDSNFGVLHSYGYNPEDLRGKNFCLLFTEEDRMRKLPEIELANTLQENHSNDNNYLLHKDGNKVWSHGESIKTINREGDIVLVKLIYDINQQKLLEIFLAKANEELRLNNEKLSWLNKDLDTFVYTASHDLKSPVNNLEALLADLAESLSEDSKRNVGQLLNLLKQSVERLKNELEDLSATAKGRNVDFKSIESIKIQSVVEEVKTNLYEDFVKSNVLFVEDFSEAPSIRISKKNLRSILFNLISNAIKYRSPDRRPVINLKTYRENNQVAIEIKDNGLGINPKDKDRIFHMYTRLHTHVEGTGLGMNIVKKIVDNYKGRIDVESEEGKGSVFKVLLPQ